MNCKVGIFERNKQINDDINNIIRRALTNEFTNNLEIVWIFSNEYFEYKMIFTVGSEHSQEEFNKMILFKSCLDNRTDGELVFQTDGCNCEATGGTTFKLCDSIFTIYQATYDGQSECVCKATDGIFRIRHNPSINVAFENTIKIIQAMRIGEAKALENQTMNIISK